jgi:hypothetical protein
LTPEHEDNAQPVNLDLPQVPQPLAQDLLHREAVLGQELAGIDFVPCTEELKTALAFARALEEADLENGDLTTAQLSRLWNPIKEVVEINDHDTLLSLKLFLSTSNSSEHVYKSVRKDLNESNPDQDILSLEAVKKKIESITGVSPLDHHMCPDSCIAYTGPFKNLKQCPYCRKDHYDPLQRREVPLQRFYTIPLGPQLQALWQTAEGARNMKHRAHSTK